MTSQALKILQEALALPDEERRLIAIELRDSLESADSAEEVDAAWRDEIVRRARRVDSGESVLLDGDEVYHRLRAKYDR